MARKSNEQSLGDVITDLLKVYRLDRRMQELDVHAAWESCMGPVVAKHTLDLRLNGKILSIRLDSGVMKEEFLYEKQRLIQNLNEELGSPAIEDIKLF